MFQHHAWYGKALRVHINNTKSTMQISLYVPNLKYNCKFLFCNLNREPIVFVSCTVTYVKYNVFQQDVVSYRISEAFPVFCGLLLQE